eukprot:scaffold16655_cov19-Tisochrysis_lutea.AAC.2
MVPQCELAQHSSATHLGDLAWVRTVHAIHVRPDADVAAAKQCAQGSSAEVAAVALQGRDLPLHRQPQSGSMN